MTQNRKSQISITLLELLIAITILTLLVLVGGGIYVSGWNMFREAQFLAQAHRNAVIPMAHMIKHLQGARNFSNTGTTILRFVEYTNIANQATTTRRYLYNGTSNQIIYDLDTVNNSGNEQTIGTRITSGTQFTVNANLTATITINATDSRNQNPYTIRSRVEARAGGNPPL